MKFLNFALFVFALCATAYAINSSWGSRAANDVNLLWEGVYRSPVVGVYSSVDVVFPKSGQTNNRTITAIFVYDNFANNSGATANLWSGGPGYKFATINFKSQYGRGINSTVQIYGK